VNQKYRENYSDDKIDLLRNFVAVAKNDQNEFLSIGLALLCDISANLIRLSCPWSCLLAQTSDHSNSKHPFFQLRQSHENKTRPLFFTYFSFVYKIL